MNTTPESNPSSAPVGPQEERSYSLVLISGLVTTVLTLLGIYVLDARTDFHIMGFGMPTTYCPWGNPGRRGGVQRLWTGVVV